MTQNEVAQQLGVSCSTILRAMKRHGMKRLTPKNIKVLDTTIGRGKGSGGHWPKGVRRSPLPPNEVKRVLRQLDKTLRQTQADFISANMCALVVGVEKTAILRWRRDYTWPMTKQRLNRLQAWCADPYRSLIDTLQRQPREMKLAIAEETGLPLGRIRDLTDADTRTIRKIVRAWRKISKQERLDRSA